MSRKPAHRPYRGSLVAVLAVTVALFAPAAARAEFGFSQIDATFKNEDGSTAVQAGSKPFEAKVSLDFNYTEDAGPLPDEELLPDGEVRDVEIELPPGTIGDATAIPRCPNAVFYITATCPTATQVGEMTLRVTRPTVEETIPVFNLTPPPGTVARLGFRALGVVPVTIDVTVKRSQPYTVVGAIRGAYQTLKVFGGDLTVWGVPGDPAHGNPGLEEKPFLALPTGCLGPQPVNFEARSWEGDRDIGTVLTHDDAEPPNPLGFAGCGSLSYKPRIESKLTGESAETGSGLDFDLNFTDEGLKNPSGLSASATKKAEVILPQGVTINPSVGEGLGVCTPDQLADETLDSEPGEGCPDASKVGTLHTTFPIIDEAVDGSIFLAQQDDPGTTAPGAENPFDSLIALYFVVRNTNLGVLAKLPVLVEPDPVTGQIVVTLDDVPQFPISHFNAHLREGARAPLVSPGACGSHETIARLIPWADPENPLTVTATTRVASGVGGGPCPPGGVPPFRPGFEAGSINNNAGAFSPFNMRLIRNDGEQNMTKFSSVLPPGVLGSLAGVSKCPDIAVPTAKSKTGRQEIALPSCPANSLIGRTLAGAGVGSALTYVGGQIYLAGPYKGAPLSVISITPAVAGPFDAGTVVVRLGLTLNPKTAEVEVDGAASDPIPHILKGIVLKVRDLRVYVDRPNFTLNPTSCDPSSAKAKLFGSFLNVIDPSDDVPVDLATRYQAANCLNLGFDPKLGLKLKGGTRRGGHPGLKAIYTPKKGEANIEGLKVRLPRSAFLDQAHIRTICTRVQYAAENCPKAAQYGYIRAWTPLLDEPLQGPVWLRSSNNKLPDLVFDLKGIVDIEVAIRIDSARGGIRATLVDAPDAPLSRVVLNMQGGRKGLIVNSRNLCARKSRANVRSTGQNGKEATRNPVMRPQCKRRKAKRSSHGRGARGSVASASSVD